MILEHVVVNISAVLLFILKIGAGIIRDLPVPERDLQISVLQPLQEDAAYMEHAVRPLEHR